MSISSLRVYVTFPCLSKCCKNSSHRIIKFKKKSHSRVRFVTASLRLVQRFIKIFRKWYFALGLSNLTRKAVLLYTLSSQRFHTGYHSKITCHRLDDLAPNSGDTKKISQENKNLFKLHRRCVFSKQLFSLNAAAKVYFTLWDQTVFLYQQIRHNINNLLNK